MFGVFIVCIIIGVVPMIYLYYSDPYWLVVRWNFFIEQQTSPLFLDPGMSNSKLFHDELIVNYDSVKEEILKNYDKGVPMDQVDDKQHALLNGDKRWITLWLKILGHDVINTLPILSSILKNHPEITTCYISTLKPGMILPPHYGPFRGVWRYQLGIQIPQGDVGICLVKPNQEYEIYRWKEKQGVVFDDTLLHMAWNRTEETRIIIFADVIKPFTGLKGIINTLAIKLAHRTQHLSQFKKNILPKDDISFN